MQLLGLILLLASSWNDDVFIHDRNYDRKPADELAATGSEFLLNALIQLERGIAGDMQDLLESISTLRHVGLERVSQRTALWLILSET